ncbi:hypothetical protein ACC790_38340, partial [Rhizobium johnstonii]
GCSCGSCSRNVTRTVPYGKTYARSRTATCDQASGSCSGSATTTGPNGSTVTRQGSVNWYSTIASPHLDEPAASWGFGAAG